MAMITLAMEAAIWYKPLRHKKLVRFGSVARGKITRMYTSKGKDSTYHHMEYSFMTRTGATITERINVHASDFMRFHEQDRITVMYSETKPRDNVIYELALYEAI